MEVHLLGQIHVRQTWLSGIWEGWGEQWRVHAGWVGSVRDALQLIFVNLKQNIVPKFATQEHNISFIVSEAPRCIVIASHPRDTV